jgi:hypothetical protein
VPSIAERRLPLTRAGRSPGDLDYVDFLLDSA